MPLSVPPAPRARARASRSTSSDRRTGRRLLTAFVLPRTSLLVLAGRASADAACGGDQHGAVHRYEVGRPLDVVLAGSTDATLQPERMPSPCPPAQQECTAQGAVDRSRAPGRQAAPATWPDSPLQAEEGCRPGLAAATQTVSSTLVVAGLIGLLGVGGAAAFIVHSVTGPVSRAVRVLRTPDKGRRGHRLRPTTLHELQDMSRAVATAGDGPLEAASQIGADARILTMPSEGSSATSGPPAAGRTTTRYAAARSRPLGPTIALWHAVELDRLVGEIGGACETAVCGSLVRVSTEQRWQVPARDVCPSCSTLTR